MSKIKNMNLDVASFALSRVSYVMENEDINLKEYKTLVKKIPTLIQKNGYINTLVFNLSKKNKAQHKEILDNIIQWNLQNEKINYLIKKSKGLEDLKDDNSKYKSYIEDICNLNQAQYRLISKEMMNLFAWIKRFADGMIQDEE